MYEKEYKNILIVVAGSTPQILTETLYDLIIQRGLKIDEIVVITTKHGKSVFESDLFNNEQGNFYRFCSEYEIKAYLFRITFVVIKNSQDVELQDIRSEEDNRDAANCIVKTIRDYADDENCRILASIAGGRRPMSAYMGYAMQLYARKHDMLFHVLAAPEALEANPFFYYPPKNKQNFVFKNRNGETISVPYDQIKIFNAEIPFIRLREILPFIHGPEAMKYEDLVEMTQKEINKVFAPQLIIKKQERTIDVKWREKIWTIKLKPIDLAFYLYMLQEKSIINSKNNEHEDKITEIYLEIRPDVDREDKLTLPDYTYKGLIDSRARINRKIKEKIKFEKMQRFIIIHSRQTDRIASYSVDLPQDFSADFIQIN